MPIARPNNNQLLTLYQGVHITHFITLVNLTNVSKENEQWETLYDFSTIHLNQKKLKNVAFYELWRGLIPSAETRALK